MPPPASEARRVGEVKWSPTELSLPRQTNSELSLEWKTARGAPWKGTPKSCLSKPACANYLAFMKQVSSDNFGILIAYVLPGFVTLIGVSFFSETARAWLGSAPTNSPTVSGFLYVTLASIGAGRVVSTIRWLIIDTIHHRTGIPNRKWDYSVLNERFHAYQFLVSNQYRYYQFYGNVLVACASSYGAFLLSKGSWSLWTFAPLN